MSVFIYRSSVSVVNVARMHTSFLNFQMMEKEHRGRFEKLENVNRRAEQKVAAIGRARDALATQLSFAAYGLVVAEYWRLMVPESALALVPYCGKKLEVMPDCTRKSLMTEYPKVWESNPQKIMNSVSVCRPVVCDVSVQTCHEFPTANTIAQSQKQHQLLLEEHGQRRTAERNEDEPVSKRPRNISTKNQATMTNTSESVSDREQFYLEQIEALQKEKINLRKVSEREIVSYLLVLTLLVLVL